MTRIIDFHTHLDDRWFDQPLLTDREFIDGLDRCRIEVACVFTLMGFYEDCKAHNDKLAERAARHTGRLLPFITVDPKLGSAAIEELERCIATKNFRGVKFHPWLQSFAPSMVKSTMIEILKRAASAKLPVIFHDGTPPYATTFQIAAAARWVPEATIVLGHAGLADYTLAAARLARDIPNLYACVCGPRTADVKHIVETAGAEKVLFGSDFGLSDWMIIEDRLDSLRFAGLSADELQRILYGNAARLLGLPDSTKPA
jgi:predicted TIM-barrel fold metal-dependent hydrolase